MSQNTKRIKKLMSKLNELIATVNELKRKLDDKPPAISIENYGVATNVDASPQSAPVQPVVGTIIDASPQATPAQSVVAAPAASIDSSEAKGAFTGFSALLDKHGTWKVLLILLSLGTLVGTFGLAFFLIKGLIS